LIYVARQLEADEERFARISAREGRIPGSSGNNDFGAVFPRTKTGNLLNFQFSYAEGSIYGKFEENYGTQQKDSVNTSDSMFSIEQLLISSRERDRRREQWMRDVQWKNFEILFLEDRPIEQRIDTLRLNQLLVLAIAQTKIELEYKYAVTNANYGRKTVLVGDVDYKVGPKKR